MEIPKVEEEKKVESLQYPAAETDSNNAPKVDQESANIAVTVSKEDSQEMPAQPAPA